MFDIGEQQLLVLLFVVQANGRGEHDVLGNRFIQQSQHCVVNTRAIVEDL